MSHQIGVAVKEQGAAIVVAEVDKRRKTLIVDITPLPFDVTAIADRLLALEKSEPADARFWIDAEGIGYALWDILDPPRGKRWTLYEGRGIDRQQLVDILIVTMYDDALRFAAGLEGQEQMNKALLSYKRHPAAVKEDGQIGSELVVALCLAIQPPPPKSIGAFLA